MSKTLNARLAAIFREHPALLVSGLYLAASFIGMFYSWAYLRRFGINVFNYAQISDFLLASLKEPSTWALVFLAVALVLIDNRWSARVERKQPGRRWAWYGSPRYRFINNFAALLMVLAFIFAYANRQANNTLDGDGKMVDVTFADSTEEHTYTLLGTTGQFVFLYDVEARRVHIHPFEAVSEIAFQAD
ncbi:MAG: hypothetical protein WBM45_00935 [Woeseiaceae bacterium]